MQSFTDMATRSIPTVLWRPVAKASFSFVPTPSVEATSTGSRYFLEKRPRPSSSRKSPAKPSGHLRTRGVNVRVISGGRRRIVSS
jgi:hypothetical protein